MEFKRISSRLTVSPQISASDVHAIAAAGFRSILCNRPDGEAADQPGFDQIEAAAKEAGLQVLYQPVQPSDLRDADARAFGAALQTLPGPVLAYCRSGTRSASLWALSQAKHRQASDILAATNAAGYDLSGLAHRIVSAGATSAQTKDTKPENLGLSAD